MHWFVAILLMLIAAFVLASSRARGSAWAAAGGVALIGLTATGMLPAAPAAALWLLYVAAALALNQPGLRRHLVSDRVFRVYRCIVPEVSRTEQEALQAGTVWWDGELFSGRPDWRKLLSYPNSRLSADEQAFLDGPVEELCAMLDDWKISHELHDLPEDAWAFIREQGFLGMIIPKRYGGLEFSARAHSEVVMKLATRSNTAAVSVMVPNALGPAELLLHYGTEAQRDHYLPRLAQGEEIPCFALTSPEAGSDASAIPDTGIVCRGEWDGRPDVLGLRLTWDKRYITLAPVATLLGLAFRLRDPERLLGETEDLGITLALIPTSTPGVVIGRRHFPMSGVFQNGPTSGRDVFVPLDWVIGGRDGCGQGWRMLMECLAAGRAISLPAQSVAGAKLASRTTGAYARVRQQFGMPIGRFEGVEEALGRIAGNTWLMDAVRTFTTSAVDAGEKPSVCSAIVKLQLTERLRAVITDGMDVQAGKGVCLGPGNMLGRAYQLAPIAITVEGANILTRCMIIFGQGAIRCHPFVLEEIAAAGDPDPERGARRFDAALWGHVGFFLSNAARTVLLALGGGRRLRAPGAAETWHLFRELDHLAVSFALLADSSMLTLGGDLKRREKLSGRLADVLCMLYLASAALKRFHDDGCPVEDRPLLFWAVADSLDRGWTAVDGVLSNFPRAGLAWCLRRMMMPFGRPAAPPSDRLNAAAAQVILSPSAARDRLTAGMYLPAGDLDPIGRLELALTAAIQVEPIVHRLRRAAREGRIAGHTLDDLAARGMEAGVVSMMDMELLRRSRVLTRAVVAVDDFPPDLGYAQAEWRPPAKMAASGQ